MQNYIAIAAAEPRESYLELKSIINKEKKPKIDTTEKNE